MAIRRQLNFAGGQISDSMQARIDTVKYATGLAKCRNVILDRTGSASNRPGTIFVDRCRTPSGKIRFLEFVFNNQQTYVIELGDNYIEFIRDGVRVREAAKTITGVANTFPHTVTSTAHGYANGDDVFIYGLVGMEVLNGRRFRVANVAANTFTLQDLEGSDIDLTYIPHDAYSSGGSAERVYKIASPYAGTEIYDIRYAQTGDIVILTHKDWKPRRLARTGHTAWTLSELDLHNVDGVRSIATTSVPAGVNTYKYKVTAVDQVTGKESLPGTEPYKTISGVTNANPCVVTTSGAHGYSDGDTVLIGELPSVPELQGREFVINATGANTFELVNVDSTNYGAFAASASDTCARTSLVVTASAVPTEGAPVVMSWSPYSTGWNPVSTKPAKAYNIYKELGGVYGFIGTTTFTTFSDKGFPVDTSDNPRKFTDLYRFENDFPQACAFTGQRLMLGGTEDKPQEIHGSRIGSFYDFTTRGTLTQDDSLDVTMAGNQYHEVRHMIERGKFIVFTAGGGWVVEGDESGNMRPGAFNPHQHTYDGIGSVPPIIVDGTVLYVDETGNTIRDFFFDFAADGYDGNDLTIFSRDLFENHQIVAIAYQKKPGSILWVLRDDGVLLGCTYVRGHRILGWHQHDFGGPVKAIAALPDRTSESGETALYLVVERKIIYSTLDPNNPVTENQYCVEKLASREWGTEIRDAIFTDLTVIQDGWNAGATTMTLQGGSFDEEGTFKLTASAAYFSAAAVGDEIHIPYEEGGVKKTLRLRIVGLTSTSIVVVRPDRTVPASLQNTGILTWGRAKKTVTGLWHLNGLPVAVFADGQVAENPSWVKTDDAAQALTEYARPAYGELELDAHAVTVHVGLPVTADIKLLPIDNLQTETLMDKAKDVRQVYVHLRKSRGVYIGTDEPARDGQVTAPVEVDDVPTGDATSGLVPLKLRDEESPDEPNDLINGIREALISSKWTNDGTILIRQIDPLPMTILAVGRAGNIPEG